MSMNQMIIFRIRRILNSNRFRIVSFIILLFSVGSFVKSASKLAGESTASIKSATYMWNLFSGGDNLTYRIFYGFFFMFAMPFLASFICSADILEERKEGVSNIIITRSSIKKYYLSGLLAVVLVVFFTFMTTFLLNQLLWIIAVPLHSDLPLTIMPKIEFEGLSNITYVSLFLNHPLLYNLFYSFLISIVAVAIGIFSYALSFFVKKRFLVVTIPAIIYILSSFVFATLGHARYVFSYLIEALPSVRKPHMSFLYLVIVMVFLVGTGIVLIQTAKSRDEFI